MRGFFAAVFGIALFAMAGCEQADSTGVDTRAADKPAVDAMSQLGRDDTILHEDDWRQLEFYPADRRPELEQALKAAKASPERHLRNIPATVTIAGRSALADLDRTLGVRSTASPFLGHGKGKVSGQLHGGFTVRLKDLLLYGVTDYNGVNVLGAVVQGEDGVETLTETFGRLHKAYGLIAVDWRSTTLLASVKEDGGLELWRP